MMQFTNIKEIIKKIVKYAEVALAGALFVGVLLYLANTIGSFISADWGTSAIFYELIYEALLISIGLELARMLVTHNFESILELLAFVIARKMLQPAITTVDIFLGIASLILIIVATRYLFPKMRHSDTAERVGDE